jgi:hypothetical protein
MSWWTYKKDKDGKVYVTSMDITSWFVLFMVVGPILFMVIGPLFAGQFFVNPTGTIRFLLWGGFLCLLAAKISLFRRGVWIPGDHGT